MFDIGFFELLIIAVVGLLVIGPEQLPSTLRTLVLWWGRFKRGLQNTRAEIEQQIGADDIRRQLHNEEVLKRLNASKEEIERAVKENVADIEDNLDIDQRKPRTSNKATEDADGESLPTETDTKTP